jgi:hypothetical protein
LVLSIRQNKNIRNYFSFLKLIGLEEEETFTLPKDSENNGERGWLKYWLI